MERYGVTTDFREIVPSLTINKTNIKMEFCIN